MVVLKFQFDNQHELVQVVLHLIHFSRSLSLSFVNREGELCP